MLSLLQTKMLDSYEDEGKLFRKESESSSEKIEEFEPGCTFDDLMHEIFRLMHELVALLLRSTSTMEIF